MNKKSQTYNLTRPLDPIFIVGAPRNGSTFLYQVLTHALNVTYLSNFNCKLRCLLPLSFWIQKVLHIAQGHSNFRANFGDTSDFGLHAPSECGEFWYRWLPRSDHFANENTLPKWKKDQIHDTIIQISNITQKPVIFKNLPCGQRLRLINDIFPNSKIIFLRRDHRFVVKSILKARRTLDIQAHEWWSVRPKNFREILKLDEVERCVAQVFHIENQIEEDLHCFPKSNIMTLNFEDLNEGTLELISNNFGIPYRPHYEIPKFKKDTTDNSDDDREINEFIKKYQSPSM